MGQSSDDYSRGFNEARRLDRLVVRQILVIKLVKGGAAATLCHADGTPVRNGDVVTLQSKVQERRHVQAERFDPFWKVPDGVHLEGRVRLAEQGWTRPDIYGLTWKVEGDEKLDQWLDRMMPLEETDFFDELNDFEEGEEDE